MESSKFVLNIRLELDCHYTSQLQHTTNYDIFFRAGVSNTSGPKGWMRVIGLVCRLDWNAAPEPVHWASLTGCCLQCAPPCTVGRVSPRAGPVCVAQDAWGWIRCAACGTLPDWTCMLAPEWSGPDWPRNQHSG